MKKEYDFSKMKEVKNPYPGKKKAAEAKSSKRITREITHSGVKQQRKQLK